jgi:hypothetical protein
MSTYFKEEQEKIETNDSIFFRIWRYYQSMNDKIQFYRTERWSLIGFLALIFFLRIYFTQGKNIDNTRLLCSYLLSRDSHFKLIHWFYFTPTRSRG